MRDWIQSIDLFVLIPTGFLLMFSYLSSYNADLAGVHLRSIVLGVLVYFSMSFLQIFDNRNLITYFFAFFVIILILLLFIGDTRGGATRWLSFAGIGFQPSEFVKIVYILLIAYFFEKFENFGIREFLITLFSTFAVFVLVALQPDLDNALAFILVFYVLLFFAVASLKNFFIGSFIVLVIVSASVPFVWHLLHDYQKDRVIAFLQPASDPLGTGYHSIQSLITVGSGGSWGKGLGNGTQFRNNFLPEHATDFAFASFAEEFGFAGSVVVIVLYCAIMLRFVVLSMSAKYRFHYYVYIGICAFIFVHVLANIGMNLGLLPVMGITLPFISFGGSSMVSFFALFGVAQGFRSPQIFFVKSESYSYQDSGEGVVA